MNATALFAKLGAFVVEHAKNVHATMYFLRFGVDPFQPLAAVPAPTVIERAGALGAGWLREEEPVVVVVT